MGIFNSGVAIGSIVAPPAIIWLQLHYGWQTTFLATGLLASSGWRCGCGSTDRPAGTRSSPPTSAA